VLTFPDEMSKTMQRVRMITSSWIFHLFLSGMIMLIVFLRPPNVFSGDTDTARNYLNTIVSSLSTILALCISIILVAIQLTASNYTHRVLDFFVRLPYNGSLFSFYLVTIMHSFFLMASIQDTERDPLPTRLQPEMSADLVLLVICFATLLLYMYKVVQLLKPEAIIGLILRDYHRASQKGQWSSALANVEQICDIAKRGASVSDSVTGSQCVEAILHIALRLPVPIDKQDAMLTVHQSVVDQWVEIAGVAVKEKESGLLSTVLNAMKTQGQRYIDGLSWSAAELVVKAYRHIVFSHLISEGQLYDVERVADRLYELAGLAVQQGERGQSFCLRTWDIIATLGENVFRVETQAISSLLNGFLLSTQVKPTLEAFDGSGKRVEAIAVYFKLWKAFSAVASRRDTARWAAWWQDTMGADGKFQDGQDLALLITSHLNREDVLLTLCYVWAMTSTTFQNERITGIYRDFLADMLDGWPVPLETQRTALPGR